MYISLWQIKDIVLLFYAPPFSYFDALVLLRFDLKIVRRECLDLSWSSQGCVWIMDLWRGFAKGKEIDLKVNTYRDRF